MKIFHPLRTLTLFALLLASVPAALAGDSLPRLKVKDLDGNKQSLKQYEGKIIVLNFWATWCGPCKEEMPMLVKEEARYAARGVQVVGVSLDQPGGQDKVRDFIATYKIDFPVWVGGTAGDLDRWKMGPAVPATAFIDSQGQIVGRVEGEMRQPALEHRLDWMLGGHSGPPPPPLENNLSK